MNFAKRSPRLLNALVGNANADTFADVSAIQDPSVLKSTPEELAQVVNVLEMMGYVEVQTGPDGAQSIRLTPSGVTLAATRA